MTGASNGQINDASAPFATGGGGGAVDSVFGRDGAVVAEFGDYNINQIDGVGSAASFNIFEVIVNDGSGNLTIGSGQVTTDMLAGTPLSTDDSISLNYEGGDSQDLNIRINTNHSNTWNANTIFRAPDTMSSALALHDPDGVERSYFEASNGDFIGNAATADKAHLGKVSGNILAVYDGMSLLTDDGDPISISPAPGGVNGNLQYNNVGVLDGFWNYENTLDQLNIGAGSIVGDAIGIYGANGSAFFAGTSISITNDGGVAVITANTGNRGFIVNGSDDTNVVINTDTGDAETIFQQGGIDQASIGFDASSNTLALKTKYDGSVLSEALVIDLSSNFVGIGTLTPAYLLDLNGSIGVQGTGYFFNGLNAVSDLQFNGDAGTSGYLAQSNGGGTAPSWINPSAFANFLLIDGGGNIYTTNAGNMGAGQSNVAIGQSVFGSGTNTSMAQLNTIVGFNNMSANTDGSGNTVMGYNAMTSNTTGSRNAVYGYNGLASNTIGVENAVFGNAALGLSVDGNNNIAVGQSAGSTLTTGSNNIFIGYNIAPQNTTGSNQLNIGNLIFSNGIDGQADSISSGNIGIGLNNPGYKLDVNGDINSSACIAFAGDYGSNGFLLASTGNAGPNQWRDPSTIATIEDAEANSGITPIADGTYSFDAVIPGNVTSLTFTRGIATGVTTL